MLQSTTQTIPVDNTSTTKRTPFDLFTSIFRRKTQDLDTESTEENSDSLITNNRTEDVVPKKPRSSPVPISGIPNQCDRTPDLSRSSSPASVKTRHLEDMEALRLSRQDNPYLQQQLERMSYQEDLPPSSCQSSCSTSPQKLQLRCEIDSADEDNVSLHQHLIRSPPPQFPQNVSQFVFLSKSDSPQHFHREQQWSDGNIIKSTSASPTQFDSLEMLQGQRLRDLNPLMTKTGVDALDPRVREVLEFQRQKYYPDQRNFEIQSSDLGNRRASDISPVPNKFLSIPSKTKWLAKAGFRPFSFPAIPMAVTSSLPGLSAVNGEVDSKCLAPVKDNRQVTGGSTLISSSSVQDLCVNNHKKHGVFTVCRMTHTSSLEPLLNSRSKSSLDSG